MSDTTADRSLPATPRRREAARRQGAMPSADLPAWAAAIGTAIVLLPSWGQATLPVAVELLRSAVVEIAAPNHGGPLDVTGAMAVAPAGLLLPTVGLVLASASAGMVVRLLFDGFSWQPARLAPDLRRINPLAGCGRIFSWSTAAAFVGNGIALATLACAAWFGCGPLVAVLRGSAVESDPVAALAAARELMLWLAVAAAAVAACHWSLQRLRFERRIRMTPQEFAEEARSMQADPKIRLLQHQQRRQPAGTA